MFGGYAQSAASCGLPGGAEGQLQSGATGRGIQALSLAAIRFTKLSHDFLRFQPRTSGLACDGGAPQEADLSRSTAKAALEAKPARCFRRQGQGRRWMRTEKDELGIRAWCEFQGRPWRVRRSRRAILTRVASFPQNPLGFGHPVPVFSRCARQSSRQVGRELLRRPYGPRLEIIPPPV